MIFLNLFNASKCHNDALKRQRSFISFTRNKTINCSYLLGYAQDWLISVRLTVLPMFCFQLPYSSSVFHCVTSKSSCRILGTAPFLFHLPFFRTNERASIFSWGSRWLVPLHKVFSSSSARSRLLERAKTIQNLQGESEEIEIDGIRRRRKYGEANKTAEEVRREGDQRVASLGLFICL